MDAQAQLVLLHLRRDRLHADLTFVYAKEGSAHPYQYRRGKGAEDARKPRQRLMCADANGSAHSVGGIAEGPPSTPQGSGTR